MKNEFDDLLNSVFGTRRVPAASGRPLPELHADAHCAAPAEAANSPCDTARAVDALQQNAQDISIALDAHLARQQKEIAQLNETALADIARMKREINAPAVQNLAMPGAVQAQKLVPGSGGAGLDGFAGLPSALETTVLGQQAYLQKLVIAFKRPYVMGRVDENARNSILLVGPACTGKHLSLVTLATALHKSGVLLSAKIAWVDLALYPTPAEEKLFLQDLYMALAGNAEIVAFTNYAACHSGFLSVISGLVQNGKSPLANRYVLQNGRLVEAAGTLAPDAVSALTPRGKYLVLLSESPVSGLADSFGGPFVSALGDVCETMPLSSSALLAVSRVEFDKLRTRAYAALRYTVAATDEALALAVQGCTASTGAQPLLQFWANAYRALAQHKLEREPDTDSTLLTVSLCVENGKLTADFTGADAERTGAIDLLSLLPQSYHGALDEVKTEFSAIVGLKEIKEYILSLEDHYKMQTRRRAKGLKAASVSMHMIFTGNPGTGKTTIARLVSKYLKAIGVLSGGQLVEVTRADLVGKYVGHTAPLTSQVLKSALGGVLFIDEAYSLYRGKDDSFGLEAIDTLVKGMEDYRDNLLVILAGYSREMAEFLSANSGLKSRFPNLIVFPDYTGQELLEITKLQAAHKGYVLENACDNVLLPYYNAMQLAHAREAGNGRLARNKVEEAILNQAKRLLHENTADLSLLLTQDFELTANAVT